MADVRDDSRAGRQWPIDSRAEHTIERLLVPGADRSSAVLVVTIQADGTWTARICYERHSQQ
jgi:hypothetical protein